MKLRKQVALFLAATLVATVALTGCGGGQVGS